MRVVYLIVICVNVGISIAYLLQKDYSASRETLILAFLLLILANQMREADG